MLIRFNFKLYKFYYVNNNLNMHRLDGPCFENRMGSKWWCKNGSYHREDGPAILWNNKIKDYCLNGIYYTEKEYWAIIRFKGYL